jgi:hypothetical protein
LCTNSDISRTVHRPRVVSVKRIVLRIATTRRENEPERNVLSNSKYVCLLHDVIFLLLQVDKWCDVFVSCVNVIVICLDACVVQLLGGLAHQRDGQVYHNVNVEVHKKSCVKMIVNFREYTIEQGRHRVRSSRSWRPTEVVQLYPLRLQ